MFRVVYLVLSYLCVPFVFAFLFVRGIGDKTYRPRRGERFGFVARNIPENCIWFHAVSAGEAIATVRVVEQLLGEDSNHKILVTTTTPMGSREVQTRLGNRVEHCYAPYDTPGSVARFLRRIKPRILLLMETELWPHLVRKTRSTGAPVYLINARLSAKSMKGYARLKDLTISMFSSLSGIACQDNDSADRFASLGYPKAQTTVTGSVKWDVAAPPPLPSPLQDAMESLKSTNEFIWIAGSTHPGEEEVVLNAHKRVKGSFPNAILVLVPRHIHRCAELLELSRRAGFRAETQDHVRAETEVILVDQMGVLFQLYGFAKIAFVGGSLQGTGGHNPIEPAIQGIPIAMGPDRHNFADICSRFEQQNCINAINDADDLASTVMRLFEEKGEWDRQSRQLRNVVSHNQGALPRLQSAILLWIKTATPDHS